MTHVRTSPYYPQSNGKLERWHGSLKQECIRPKTPLNLSDARRVVEEYLAYYNDHRLHSAIGYVAPKDKQVGNETKIFAVRKQKLEEAREKRRIGQFPVVMGLLCLSCQKLEKVSKNRSLFVHFRVKQNTWIGRSPRMSPMKLCA
jgi:Integrase core domain